MSEENVQLVRRGWEAFKAIGGERGVDAYFDEMCADDIVSEDFPELPDRAIYLGREGVLQRYRNFVESWEDIGFEPIEFIDSGDDSVIVVVAMSGHGEGSGVPLDGPAVFLYDLRDGRIVRDRAFMSRSQALAAAGQDE